MKNKLVLEILTSMADYVEMQNLHEVRKKIEIILSDYNVSAENKALINYEGFVPDCLKIYLVAKSMEGLAPKTLSNYKNFLEKFFNTVGKDVSEISTNDVRVFLFKYQNERDVSNRTLSNRKMIISSFFEWCVNEDYILKNPCKNIKDIKYVIEERNPLTQTELEQLRLACETLRERAILEFFYSTGCRVAEISGCKKSDINLETGEVTLFGKGSKYRTSYVNEKAKMYLKMYLDERNDDSEYLFVSKLKTKMSTRRYEMLISSLGTRAGISDPVFPHRLRHTTATDCLKNGMDITEVQKLLGHSNVETTMIYAQVNNENIKHKHKSCLF